MRSDSENLSGIEQELIEFFVNAAQSIGLPRSIGEIYGLYFASEKPLALDEVVEKLQISKGSASQGIRFLKSIHALNPTSLPGDRRDHYTPELSLRQIAHGFISQRIRPELKDGADRLTELSSKNSEMIKGCLPERIATIQSWSQKARLVLPIISKFLSTKAIQQKTVA